MTSTADRAAPSRLISLDTLRGLTILLMLLVNNMMLDEATPPILTHAPWRGGVFLADFVLPLFLFCVGIALTYSWKSFLKKKAQPGYFYLKALQRTIILFLLGCALQSSITQHIVISMGVLQLIGLAFFAGALAYIIPPVWRIGLALSILTAYWAAVKFIPVPGIGTGIFEEEQSLLIYVNKAFLDPFHMAGLLSVIPTSALVILGTVVGDMMSSDERSPHEKLRMLIINGAISILGGVLWNLHFPYSKAFWTSSYILLMTGIGMILLGLFYFIIEIKGFKRWAYPLVIFGSNAIFAYVVPILFKLWILQRIPIAGADTRPISLQQWFLTFLTAKTGIMAGSWLYTFFYILVWWLILWLLYRRKIFFKI